MSAWMASLEQIELRRRFDEDEDEFEDDGFSFDDEDDEDEEVEKNLGLFTAVERARAYLEKLRSIAADLESQGIDVTEATSLLDQVEATLNSAEDALNQGDFDAAEKLLRRADDLLAEGRARPSPRACRRTRSPSDRRCRPPCTASAPPWSRHPRR